MTIDELIFLSHETAKAKGWWNGSRSAGDQFANFHAEVSEAWEEWRKNGWRLDRMIYPGENGKPEGLAVELADLLIRVADTCGKYGIPLKRALREKMDFNRSRPYRHGNKMA